ncbi:MAG: mobile mystery protein A [Burkholderiales bacterium]|nr:mobile mystery protein A [Burkholderiales bacterium]
MSVRETARLQSRKKVNANVDALGARPPAGWITTVRQALGISGAQLARRLGVTRAAVYRSEQAERDGSITLNRLQEIAGKMGCRVVYALVPETGRIETVLQAQARYKAEQLLQRANTHMSLEAQALSSKELATQRELLVQELLRDLPTDLWDTP